jgi:tetratricopeptide (TPR) repeat protein
MYTSSGILSRAVNRKQRSFPGSAALIIGIAALLLSCLTQEKTAPAGDIPEFAAGIGHNIHPALSGKERETLSAQDVPQTGETLSPDNSTQGILRRISRLLTERQYSQALTLFDDIDPADAGAPDLQLIKASIYNAAGESAAARAIANDILSRQPENTEALLVLAASAVIEGKDREQRTILERVIKIEPQNIKALCDLGYIALWGKSLRTAAGYFDRALAADNTSGDALIGRAVVYRYNHDPKKSEQLLNQAIILYPRWASPLNERARLYRGAGFYKDALADLDAAKKLDPVNYWISVERGMTLVDLSRRQEALEEFAYAITLNPNNFLAYVYSAGLNDDLGNLAGAEKDYTMITKLKPEYYFAHEGLGIIKMKKQEWDRARDAFLAAYKYDPKNYSYALLAAANWMRAGKINDPKQFLAQVLRTAPRDSADWHMLRLYHDLAGDSDLAARIEREKDPDDKARMLFYFANYYDIRGSKTLADRYFLQVQELNRRGIPEWRINEWFIEQREINIF